MIYKSDCLHFLGHVPCKPHKQQGFHCENCPVYTPIEKRILIIKLGAMGDVIRTTPLITRYKKLYPSAKFTWITLFPDILPKNEIHEIYKLGVEAILYAQNTDWDIAINLDKEKEASALLKMVNAKDLGKPHTSVFKPAKSPHLYLITHNYSLFKSLQNDVSIIKFDPVFSLHFSDLGIELNIR